MKKLALSLFVFILIRTTNSVYAQTTIFKSEISFEFVSKNVKGTIAGFKSNSIIDFKMPENSTFEGTVAVNTLDTNNGLRNWSLKSGKYFDEDDFPRIKFKSTTVSKKENSFIVKGDLTLKGTTKPIVIVFNKQKNQLLGTTSIYCSDYGIKIKKKREDNLVKITLKFTLKSID